tara:strand:+ start:14039 stop:14869 length:831 start_codon:yes stop_codon:yes gene_type:complete
MQKLFESWREFLVERAMYISSLEQAYQVLGLNPGADDTAAKRAYRKIASKVHPDVNPSPDANQAFQKAAEAYEAITWKGPGSFAYKRGGAGDSGGRRSSASADPSGDLLASWKATGPMYPGILTSLQTIIGIVAQAIETNQSVKVDGIKVPGDVVIAREDFENLSRFMRHYQYENLRVWAMGGGASTDFVNNKIMNTLKSVSISPKFGSGKEDLQNFVNILKRVVPGEEAKEEPGAPEPEPESTSSQDPWGEDWDAKYGGPVSDEEMEDFKKKWSA